MKYVKVAGLVVSFAIGIPSVSMAANSLCNQYQSDFLGPKVCVFDAKSTPSEIQSVVNSIHNTLKGEAGQFNSNGYALLFKPGTYSSVSVPVGFYTQVLGLGLTPRDTTLQTVTVGDDDLIGGTSLDNFWRGAENFTTEGNVTWAVSQASPLRNIHVMGQLNLAMSRDMTYASGGFLANSLVDGVIASSNQQQWVSRNTSMAGWPNRVWNMVFVGDRNAPTQTTLPITTLATTPRIQEKPYLAFDQTSQQYQVVVPALNHPNSVGQNWDTTTIIPQSDIYVAKPGVSVDEINTALKTKKALIFTPGQYSLNQTINVTQPNTVILGLGVPVLTETTPHIPLIMTSASGVKIGGLIIEPGSNAAINTSDPSLLQIGTGKNSGNANSPSTLSDIYCRVGGRVVAQTNSCITINDSDVIGDNLWLWRADHGAGGSTWYSDQANHGLIVNGANVTMYGLAVEHFQQEQVLWSGDNGSVYFYQSELPYDVPGNTVISASFVLNNTVTKFNGYGFGVYDFFRTKQSGGADPYALSAIKVPNRPGISFTHMISVKLGTSLGSLHIAHMVETTDGQFFGPSSAPGMGKYEAWPEAKKN